MAQSQTNTLPMWQLVLWKGQDRLRRQWRTATAHWLPPRGRRPHDWEKTMAAAVGNRSWSDHFAKRDRRWLWTNTELNEVASWMQAHRPDICRATLWRAQRAVTRRVDVLGHGEITLPESYDWVTDPISGARWPSDRAERIPLILDDPRSDIKHLWEIARFAFAPILGAAWRTTGDRSCAKSLVQWIDDFIAHNPYGCGPHWTNPMEAAIRAVNWMVGWRLCQPATDDEQFVRRLIGSLIDHGRFIAANLERTRRGVNTNHYIADLAGLYAIATFLPEWPESARWRALTVRELRAEAEVQILPDGFCYESSFAYHRLTFEMWFFVWCLADRLGEPDLKRLAGPLQRMATFSMWNADDTGGLPPFGDGDDGRFVFWQPRDPHDHTTAWDLAEAAWGPIAAPHPRNAPPDPAEDTLWLLGTRAYQRLFEQRSRGSHGEGRPTGEQSCLFPDAQVAVLRSRRWLIHAFANPVGTGGVGGHKHNDMLSLTATCDGTPMIVDPGTWAYTTDPALRNQFRRTAAHATVVIDGQEQNRFLPRQLFALRAEAAPEVTSFEQTDTIVRVAMRHDGYRRLVPPIILEREIELNRATETVSVTDQVTGTGNRRVDVVFPLGDVPAFLLDARTVRLGDPGSPSVTLAFRGEGDWSTQVIAGWRSEAYGQKRNHRRLIFTADLSLPAKWTVSLTLAAVAELENVETLEAACAGP